MSDGQLTAIIIVAIVMFASIVKTAIGGGHSRRRDRRDGAIAAESQAEVARLRDELARVKDRVAVLERIATDKNLLLEQEFERLRDEQPRNRMPLS